MTHDPQDFEASLLPSEDLIMSMSPGDYVVVGGLKMEMSEVDQHRRNGSPMAGKVFMDTYVPERAEGTYPWLTIQQRTESSWENGRLWDKQHLAKSIAAGEFWIG
jgi:hypothetical protein